MYKIFIRIFLLQDKSEDTKKQKKEENGEEEELEDEEEDVEGEEEDEEEELPEDDLDEGEGMPLFSNTYDPINLLTVVKSLIKIINWTLGGGLKF